MQESQFDKKKINQRRKIIQSEILFKAWPSRLETQQNHCTAAGLGIL
jgi:hypothetical protein